MCLSCLLQPYEMTGHAFLIPELWIITDISGEFALSIFVVPKVDFKLLQNVDKCFRIGTVSYSRRLDT